MCITIKTPFPDIAMLLKNALVDYINISMLIFKADIYHIKTENETNDNYCQNNYDNNTPFYCTHVIKVATYKVSNLF